VDQTELIRYLFYPTRTRYAPIHCTCHPNSRRAAELGWIGYYELLRNRDTDWTFSVFSMGVGKRSACPRFRRNQVDPSKAPLQEPGASDVYLD
jgi:hypothetical protein